MIHAKDLMIGDWVKSRGKIEEVTSVYEGYICTDSFEDSHDYYFEPISLTPEILEKNGFYKDELTRRTSQWILNDDHYDIIVYKVSDSIWCIEYDNTEANLPTRRNLVCFVHEFQHCFKMFGVEKSFEL